VVWRLTQLVYLMAPAYVANMTPPFSRFWPGWNRPISERLLGSHKTVIGALGGVLAAVITAGIQAKAHWRGASIDYTHWPIVGLLLGVGAIGGDVVKSFIKRRMNIPPGGRWIPADQLDFSIGALALIAPMARLSLSDIGLVLLVTFVGDIGVNHVAYKLGIRDTAW
jgi:CDP-2,3-bis-(O-geranylgeranyl)-sn-glycerol synthase